MDGRDRVATVILALGVVAAIGVRLHVLDDDFPNPDIAGIVYNAEILLAGGLPYVDTAEIKPPGAFLLAALSIATLGRGLIALQLVHALWLGVGALGVWWAARAIHRDDSAVSRRAAALAAAVALVAMAMFSYNYSSWMTPASALAVGAALQGLRRDRMHWHVLAGAAALLAFATIQRAGVLAILLPAMSLWARPGGQTARRALIGWLAGGALALAAVAAPWIVAGEIDVLVRALLPWQAGRDYAASAGASVHASLGAAAVQLVRVFWFPLSLVALALVAARAERSDAWRAWWPGALWLAASIVGAAIGGARFYLHYLVQYAPALGLLAGHPALVRAVARAMAREDRGRIARIVAAMVAAATALALVEIAAGRGHRYEAMARRLTTGLTAAQAAGEHIRLRTDATATVQAWGWTAWPIYYWSERRAPSRIYKALGWVTTFNTNTEFAIGEGPRFRPGPAADELVAAFDLAPPEYFVYSPSMVDAFGAAVDPLEDFVELRRRLADHYALDAVYGDLRLFRRRAP